jgi:hypothetical protein
MPPAQSLPMPMPASWRDLLGLCRPAFRRSSTFAMTGQVLITVIDVLW